MRVAACVASCRAWPSRCGTKRGVRWSLLWRWAASTCQFKPPAPPSSSAAAARSCAAPPSRSSARPPRPASASRGMRLSSVLTTPPVALPPYSSAAGPRSTSMRSTTSGSMATAWSKLRLDASADAPPLSSRRMRSPSSPRITGRLACGPKPVAETPGRPASVSPSVPARRMASASPASTLLGWARLSLPSGLPVITTRAAGGSALGGAGLDGPVWLV